MDEISRSPISLTHISFAIAALLSGTLVLLLPKGTVRHQRVGHAYVASMMVVLTTAFGIYRLFGCFNFVYWAAVLSWMALPGGLGAVWLWTYLRHWLRWYYLGMSLSVSGLDGIFVVKVT